MSRRLPIIILVAVAVAAGAIGYVATRGSRDTASDVAGATPTGDRSPATLPGAPGATGAPGTLGPAGEPGSTTPSSPGDPAGATGVPGSSTTAGNGVPGSGTGGNGVPGTPGAGSDPAAPGAAEKVEPKIYVMDNGTVVRDHRRGGGAPPLATTPLPPEQRTMNPQLTNRVFQALAPRVATCAAAVPTAARKADPFVYINLTVTVAAGTLRATDVVPVAHDVADSAAGTLVSCVREALLTLQVDAAGEPAVSGYVLQYPVRLR